VFGVEGGVTPTSNRKQIQDIGAEVAIKMAKSKNRNFTPPKKKKFLVGIECYPNCAEEIDNRISCKKFMKIGPVKLQLQKS